jgi:hypothetical protein
MPHDAEQPPKSAPSVGSWQRIPPFPRIQRALITPQNLDQSTCAGTNSGVGGIDQMPKQAENNEVLDTEGDIATPTRDFCDTDVTLSK